MVVYNTDICRSEGKFYWISMFLFPHGIILKEYVTEIRFNKGKKNRYFGKGKLLHCGFTLINASDHKFSELFPNLGF